MERREYLVREHANVSAIRVGHRNDVEYPAMAPSEAWVERGNLRAVVKGGANPAQVARIDRAAKVELSETVFSAIAAELLAK